MSEQANEPGDVIVHRTGDRIVVQDAPKRAVISADLINNSDPELMTIEFGYDNHPIVTFGTEGEGAGRVTYRAVEWYSKHTWLVERVS